MNEVSMIGGVKPEVDKTRRLKIESPGNTEYRFGYITFKELDEENNHPDYVQRRIKHLREELECCPDITPDFPCYFYIVNSEDQIVCSIKALPDILQVAGHKYPWAWMGALFTEESLRGTGLATKITEESKKILNEQGFAWGGVFSTDVAIHIYKKLNFKFLGYVSRYLMIKSAKPFLKVHIKPEIIAFILDVLSRPIFIFIYRYYFGRRKKELSHVRLTIFNDAETNESPLPELYYESKYHFNDRVTKLLWKVKGANAKPENDCSLYLLEDIENGCPLCYFALRLKNQLEPLAGKYKDFKLMTLMDYGLFKEGEGVHSILLKKVKELFWKSDAEILEVISNSPQLIGLMEQRGMIKVGKGMSFTFSAPRHWELNKESNDIKSWHLTNFCGDAFSF